MKKKIIFLALLISSVVLVNAQEQGKFRGGLNFGFLFPGAGFGVGGDLDFRYNILDNLNTGLRFGLNMMARDIDRYDEKAVASAFTYSLINANYYFNKANSNFAPFVGGGIGRFSLGNAQFSLNENSNTNNLAIDRRFGGNLSIGFEAAKFRLSFEYFMIPRSNLYDLYGNKVGEIGNSFVNLTVGFYLGGGKWRKY